MTDEFEEEYGIGYDNDTNDSGAGALVGDRIPDLLDRDYDAEDLTYLGTLKESEVSGWLRNHIESSSLLAGAQRALLQIVDTYISRDFVLSNIENPAYALNNLDTAFSLAVLSATTYNTRRRTALQIFCRIASGN